MKRFLILLAVVAGLVFVLNLLSYTGDRAIRDLAIEKCQEKGLQQQDLYLLEFRYEPTLLNYLGFAHRGTVEFQIRGAEPPKKVRVELVRHANLMPWEVDRVTEILLSGGL